MKTTVLKKAWRVAVVILLNLVVIAVAVNFAGGREAEIGRAHV